MWKPPTIIKHQIAVSPNHKFFYIQYKHKQFTRNTQALQKTLEDFRSIIEEYTSNLQEIYKIIIEDFKSIIEELTNKKNIII